MITAAIWLVAVAWPATGKTAVVRIGDQALVLAAAILLTIAVNS